MKKIIGFMGAAAIAAALTACGGDPALKAAQNYKFPGSDLTLKRMLDKSYSYGKWEVVPIPENLRKDYRNSEKFVFYTGVTHGAKDIYKDFVKGASESACAAVKTQYQSVMNHLEEVMNEHSEKKERFKEIKSELEDNELKLRACEAHATIAALKDFAGRSMAKEMVGVIVFRFDESGVPIMEEGEQTLGYAAKCADSPSTCSVEEDKRAKKIAGNYEHFKENGEGSDLKDRFVSELSKEMSYGVNRLKDKVDEFDKKIRFEEQKERAAEASAGAYDLMKDEKFSKDIDKVLKDVAGLESTGETQLGGRRGKADGGFNEGYAEAGSGGIGDGLAGLLGGGGGGIATKAKGSIKTPSERDINMNAGSPRSAAEIQKVVKQRTPGLRHIYNKFLKKKPGFAGKVTLKFTIAPGGEIISIVIASSTTGFGEFDVEIKSAVSRWRFGTVKSGNTTVSIPFTFSE